MSVARRNPPRLREDMAAVAGAADAILAAGGPLTYDALAARTGLAAGRLWHVADAMRRAGSWRWDLVKKVRRRPPMDDAARDLSSRPEWLALAADLARAAARRWGRYEDVFESAAMVGLCRAAQGFDPSRGTPFDRYARRCIRAEIANAHRDEIPDDLARHVPFAEDDERLECA